MILKVQGPSRRCPLGGGGRGLGAGLRDLGAAELAFLGEVQPGVLAEVAAGRGVVGLGRLDLIDEVAQVVLLPVLPSGSRACDGVGEWRWRPAFSENRAGRPGGRRPRGRGRLERAEGFIPGPLSSGPFPGD